MTLPRVSAAAVKAGAALDRADNFGDLEAAWHANACNDYRRADRRYLQSVYLAVAERLNQRARRLDLAKAI